MRPLRSRIALVSASTLCAAFASFTTYADTDACSLLTPAQVSAVIGVPVGAGAHVTPTFVKTCTWKPTGGSDIRAVTVNLQTSAFYDGAKQKASNATALGLSMRPAAVGDDGFVECAVVQKRGRRAQGRCLRKANSRCPAGVGAGAR